MKAEVKSLWPYSTALAIAAIPVVWLLFGIAMALTHTYLSWPNAEFGKLVLYVAVIASVIPLTLVLLDFLSLRGAVIDIKGVKLAFSRMEIESRQESFRIPENIGEPAAVVSSSGPMKIMTALKQASGHESIRLDLKDGNAWWATRLLALSAGAVRAGTPKILIFTGMKERVSECFLGWAQCVDILKALLTDKPEYQERYLRASQIAKQVGAFSNATLRPSTLTPVFDVQRYLTEEVFELGDAAFEQILLDQLGSSLPPFKGSLETPPDRITLGRFHALFEHCLCKTAIDLNWPTDRQMTTFWESESPYLALVRTGKYEGVLKRETAEHFMMRRLLVAAQRTQEPARKNE